MDKAQVLSLVKAGIPIQHTARDAYINAIIDGVIEELEEEKGLMLDGGNSNHLIFVVDYVTWRYQNRGAGKMPRHLQFRLHNMFVHARGDGNV